MAASSEDTGAGASTSTELPRVLFLGDHFGYPSGVAHGATTYMLNVLPSLVAAGVDITVCFLREEHPAAAPLRGSRAEPIFLSAHPLNPFVVFRVAKIARQRGCGLIHAAGLKATLVARIIAPMVGAKALLHVHDLTYPKRGLSALHRWFSKAPDSGLCVSQAAREVGIKGYHVSPERCHVLYNGIRLDVARKAAPEARASCRAELQIAADANVITMIGRMHRVKGHREMLQMMVSILRACPNTVLLLVGDGPERSACERLVAQLGLQAHVRFVGHRSDVPELLAASDLVLMPSHSEGLPYAAIEGLAVGKPVVAYAVGGIPEVVSADSDGVLAESGNQAKFVEAVVMLLGNQELRETFGRRGKIAAERFSLDRHIAGLLKLYREIAGRLPS